MCKIQDIFNSFVHILKSYPIDDDIFKSYPIDDDILKSYPIDDDIPRGSHPAPSQLPSSTPLCLFLAPVYKYNNY